MLPIFAITVLVLVGGDAAADAPQSRAMEHALSASLGEGAVVRVQNATNESDDALVALGKREDATLVGIVTWSDGQRRATIRFVRPSDGRWSDREIRFDASDAPSERGRTVGFALASGVPDESRTSEPKPPPPPAPAPTLAPTTGEHPVAPPPVDRGPLRHAIELATQAAVAVGGEGGGIGGTFGVRLGLADTLKLRIAGGIRFAEIDAAQATSRVYRLGGGFVWEPTGSEREWVAGVRLEGLAIGHEVVHFSSDDPSPAHQFRVLPGAAAALEGSWRFADRAFLCVAIGGEIAFGSTDVFLGAQKVAELTPLRPFGEVGGRVAF